MFLGLALYIYIYQISTAKMLRQHCMLALHVSAVFDQSSGTVPCQRQTVLLDEKYLQSYFSPFLVKLIEFCVENISFCSLSIIFRLIYVL
jgi:hypothetical protein